MTDELALQQYALEKDAEAFRFLVEQYQRLVYATAARRLGSAADVEDAVQLTFLKLARAAGTVRQDLAAWLHRTALNTANDLIRRDQARRRHEEKAAVAEGITDEWEKREWQQLSLLMDEAIEELPAAERTLLLEHFFSAGGRSQRDLATEMGVSQPTVQRRIQSAVESLRAILRKRGCVAAAALVLLGLADLGKADVPAAVTDGLTKIGVAGSGGGAPPLATGSGIAGGKMLAACALVVALVGGLLLRMNLTRELGGAGASRTPVVPSAGSAPATPVTNATLPALNARIAPVNRAAALTRLTAIYRLADGENLRKFPTPYPVERTDYVAFDYPPATHGADFTVGFWWQEGSLQNTYMSYGEQELDRLIESALRMPWYQLDHLDRITWQPGKADWVVRDPLSSADKLAALAKIISAETGKPMHFERRSIRRPCVMVTGEVRSAPVDSERFRVLAVNLAPLPAGEFNNWLKGGQPSMKLWTHFQLETVGRALDAPCFSAVESDVSKYQITPDARLKRTDPDYLKKLRTILDNIEAQIGGTWAIKEREIETWEPAAGVAVPD